MQRSIIPKGFLMLLGAASLASAQGFKYWDVADTSKVPKLISQTGLYTNLAMNKNMISAAVPFEVNSALWSDGSHKKRWVLLKPNTSIVFKEDSDYWKYPDSAIFVKNFAIDTIPGDTTSRVLWETRFLVLKREAHDPGSPTKLTDQWYGYSYRWRKDQKEADLVHNDGQNATIKWYPKGRNQPAALKKWVFPSRDKCLECHKTNESDTLHGRSVLGFFTAQLNMPSPLNPSINQIEDFFNKKVFTGTKPANYANAPRWWGIESTDPAATLEKKAYSYIAANCSGCHGDRGMELGATFGVDLNYDYFLGKPHMKFEYKGVSWNYGLDTIAPVTNSAEEERFKGVYLVTPGYPQKSVIVHRQKSRNTVAADDPDSTLRSTAFDTDRNQMPPLATFEVNEKAMKVISDWIASLPQTGATAIRGSAKYALLTPSIQGRTVRIPTEMIRAGLVVRLIGVDGRSQALPRIGHGVYGIPTNLTPGIFILQVGKDSFTRYLF